MDDEQNIVNDIHGIELTDDYILTYKELDDVLEDIDFAIDDDKHLCRSIIDSLEKELAKQLLDGKCVQIPYIGTVRKNPVRVSLIANYKEFKEKRSTLTKDEYKEYCRNKVNSIKRDVQNKEIHRRKMNTFKRKFLKLWMNKRDKFGDVYADLYLFCIRNWTVIEFDWDLEIAYQESRQNG